MTQVTKYSDEQIEAKTRELKSQGIRYVLGSYVDIHGVPKAKCVPLAHFPDMAKKAGGDLAQKVQARLASHPDLASLKAKASA